MKHLDLFSGIGGFALAARRVGWETVGFCEIDPFCQKVLAKHWPGVPIYDDVQKVVADTRYSRVYQCGEPEAIGEINNAGRNGRNGIPSSKKGQEKSAGFVTDGTTTVGPIDIITGGFPCQDISYAGKGAGIEGERSGLWTELARIIGEVRPRYAVLENVAALLSRGLDRVTGDLAEIGYDCEWHCIPASAVGAPHRRDRIWIACYPNGESEPVGTVDAKASGLCGDVAHPHKPRLEGRLCRILQECAGERAAWAEGSLDDAHGRRYRPQEKEIRTGWDGPFNADWWLTEPDVGRVANGVPSRVDRLRSLGNAIVPQVAEVIFRAIQEADNEMR